MGVIKAINNLLLPGRRPNRSLSTLHKAMSIKFPASAVGRRLLFFSLRVLVAMVALVQLMVDVGVRRVPRPPPTQKKRWLVFTALLPVLPNTHGEHKQRPTSANKRRIRSLVGWGVPNKPPEGNDNQ